MIGPRIDRIVVGVDGSADARRALEWALAIGGRFDSELVVVHAVGLLSHLTAGPSVPSQSHLDELRRVFVTEWCAPLAGFEGKSQRLLLNGPPVPVLLETAQRHDADVIVVGSRGRGGFAELRLGSTSHQVAEHADCPVLIVPPDQDSPNRRRTSREDQRWVDA